MNVKVVCFDYCDSFFVVCICVLKYVWKVMVRLVISRFVLIISVKMLSSMIG